MTVGEIIAAALLDQENPVECISNPNISGWARQNDKNNGMGRIQFYCPDEWCKNLSGGENVDAYVLMRLPRGIFDNLQVIEEPLVADSSPVEDTTPDAEKCVVEPTA